jgi:hypothetical protein
MKHKFMPIFLEHKYNYEQNKLAGASQFLSRRSVPKEPSPAKENYGHATRPGWFLNFAPWRLLCRALAKKLC